MPNKAHWIGLMTLVEKEVRRFMRLWMQTLLPPVVTTVLYFVIFGQLMGARIGTMGGVSYIEFIAPGLIMMSIITNSYISVSSAFYLEKLQRSIEELLVSPMPNYMIILGFVLSGIIRGFVIGFK